MYNNFKRSSINTKKLTFASFFKEEAQTRATSAPNLQNGEAEEKRDKFESNRVAISPLHPGDQRVKKESWPVKAVEAKGTAKRRGNVAVPGAQRRWHRGPLVGGGSVGRGRPINMAAGEGVAEAHEGYAKGSFTGETADGTGEGALLRFVHCDSVSPPWPWAFSTPAKKKRLVDDRLLVAENPRSRVTPNILPRNCMPRRGFRSPPTASHVRRLVRFFANVASTCLLAGRKLIELAGLFCGCSRSAIEMRKRKCGRGFCLIKDRTRRYGIPCHGIAGISIYRVFANWMKFRIRCNISYIYI